MSNIERFENLKQVVKLIQPQFDELAKIHGAVNYVKEASFALQILTEKEFTANTAIGNQDSLKRAIINVAAIGLSLDPVKKLAYLVPRGKQICLDISYRGYVQLAVEVGAIKWAVAEVVREKDEYLYQGMGREPIHKFDPFGDRGEIRGAYCLAKTHDSEFILTQMNNDEILSIRDRSQKSWPMIDTRSQARFEQAIDVTNDIDFSQNEAPAIESKSSKRHHQVDIIRAYLKTLKRTEEKYIPHLEIVNNREIKRIEDLTDIELNQAVIMLEDLVGKQKQKEAVNENAG
jgi:hypothetical protein